MNRKQLCAAFIVAAGLGIVVSHGEASTSKADTSKAGQDMTPYTGSKEFEKLKTLAGHWEGTGGDMQEHGDKVTLDYKVTSGGSAVIETLFPGTPHEMVSVYSEDGGRLTMTHYCMLKNHPKLELKKAAGPDLNFTLAKDGNVDPQSMHMHNLVVSIPSSNQLVQKWTSYNQGKEQQTSTFNFNRK